MRTEELFEQCLQALSSGEELPPDLARYLRRNPEQRSEVEALLAVAQRAAYLPAAELSPLARKTMYARLAARLGFHPAAFEAPEKGEKRAAGSGRKPRHLLGRASLAKLRYEPPYDESEARIRSVFHDLTPEDIRRYIGVRGEDYLYYRQRFPHWKPVFAVIAAVLRGLKRIEMLASIYN